MGGYSNCQLPTAKTFFGPGPAREASGVPCELYEPIKTFKMLSLILYDQNAGALFVFLNVSWRSQWRVFRLMCVITFSETGVLPEKLVGVGAPCSLR